MIGFSAEAWLRSVGEFLQTPVGRALVWLVPAAALCVGCVALLYGCER